MFKTNDGECVMLAPQEFTTLNDLKKFPNLRKLYLRECRVENNEALRGSGIGTIESGWICNRFA